MATKINNPSRDQHKFSTSVRVNMLAWIRRKDFWRDALGTIDMRDCCFIGGFFFLSYSLLSKAIKLISRRNGVMHVGIQPGPLCECKAHTAWNTGIQYASQFSHQCKLVLILSGTVRFSVELSPVNHHSEMRIRRAQQTKKRHSFFEEFWFIWHWPAVFTEVAQSSPEPIKPSNFGKYHLEKRPKTFKTENGNKILWLLTLALSTNRSLQNFLISAQSSTTKLPWK